MSYSQGPILTSRLEKYLLALKCLEAAREVDPEDPTLHEQSVRFRQTRPSLLDL
jgi:hypothetical protein